MGCKIKIKKVWDYKGTRRSLTFNANPRVARFV